MTEFWHALTPEGQSAISAIVLIVLAVLLWG